VQKLLKHPLLQSSVTSYVFQSSQEHHQCLLKAQMILLKADLAAWLVYAIAMNTLISTLPSWPYM